MSDLVEVPFYGDAIQAVREGQAVSVVVKRVCESLGLGYSSQLQKLKEKPWACVTLVVTQMPDDDQRREVACLSLDALPMWLATIEPSRVKPEARFKLVAYQKECARVLRDHFFGRPAAAADTFAELERRFNAMVAPVIEAVGNVAKAVAEISGATVRPIDAAWLKREVCEIARMQVAAGMVAGKTPRSAENSARRRIYNKLGTVTGWFGTGRDWRSLPAGRWPEARALLVELRREATSQLQRNDGERQLQLVTGSAGVAS